MASQESGKEASGSDPSFAPKKRKKAVKEMNIRVIIRIRPLNTNELAHQEDIATEYDEDRREISVSSMSKNKQKKTKQSRQKNCRRLSPR